MWSNNRGAAFRFVSEVGCMKLFLVIILVIALLGNPWTTGFVYGFCQAWNRNRAYKGDVGRTRKGEIMLAWFLIAVILFIVIRWPTWFVLTAIALFILICWPIARPLLLMVVSV